MKRLKLYIEEKDIKEKLGQEYQNSNILFTKVSLGEDNTVTFECVVTEEDVPSNDVMRQRLINFDRDKRIMGDAKILSEISGLTLGQSVDCISRTFDAFNIK